jgi:hypothetical protein
MSGGSYDYLYAKDADELFNYQRQLNDMIDRLAGLGYAKDAAAETDELLLILRQTLVRVETRMQRLRDVWRAVEMWDSCDGGEDAVKEALSKYREDPAQAS